MFFPGHASAGFPMLPVLDSNGRRTSVQIIGHTVLLLVSSTLLSFVAGLGPIYLAGSIATGCGFLACGIVLATKRSNPAAKMVFLASLVYLPLLLALVVIDRLMT